jgi:hypothetical protein
MSGVKGVYREWELAMMDRIVETRLKRETREDWCNQEDTRQRLRMSMWTISNKN